jgi:hypothetical protein
MQRADLDRRDWRKQIGHELEMEHNQMESQTGRKNVNENTRRFVDQNMGPNWVFESKVLFKQHRV